MIHTDTQVLVWLFNRQSSRLSDAAKRIVAAQPLLASPMTIFELQMIRHKTGTPDPLTVLARLRQLFRLTVAPTSFEAVARAALDVNWTRDPFDRLIVANAMADGAQLLTADRRIRENFAGAVW